MRERVRKRYILLRMCFSPAASFTAAAGLSSLGILTLSKVRRKEEIPFAMIPLLFGIQQAVEGFVWISIQQGNVTMNSIASHIFVIFAYVGWPVFVPVAVILLEKVPWRKYVLYVFELLGIALGAYFIYFLTQVPVMGHVANRCIVYTTPPLDATAIILLYVAATCLSLMFSSHRIIKWFGLAASASLVITYAAYSFALVSVWCFFSAILSGIVYFFFTQKTRR